jgi:type IV secretory pathway protease TraF
MPAHVRAIRYLPFANLRAGRSVDCGEGWFVLGDFTRDSADSRYEGPVLPRRLVGRAWLVLWPPSRFGFVR